MPDLCWRYGITILPLDAHFVEQFVDYESVSHLKSFSVPSSKARRGTIYIKENLGHIEKKLLLAEEFCHLYSHGASQLSIDKHSLSKLEKQAKKMSAYLLMPARFINSVYEAAYDEAVVISDIADYFLVTEEFAQYRLELIFNRKVDAFVSHWGMLGTFKWFE
ncbi:ImmA/IrrE family metallo-endopeptidase [Sporosarcina sp. resist]|uniref:ImmA/IrrE family metallo-endopeptidase n=1 Tax=Sporosarcina sp. resist TaxID=2762563 RepID=UPI00164DD500|nr:ImmA/IrrE family metallo-endopeptidase [Sporosarcina sp. resist]QNK87793.1 ImmA/IrrE family metallo-endopeptidase [Sporosarcina sp. resist]